MDKAFKFKKARLNDKDSEEPTTDLLLRPRSSRAAAVNAVSKISSCIGSLEVPDTIGDKDGMQPGWTAEDLKAELEEADKQESDDDGEDAEDEKGDDESTEEGDDKTE